MIAGKTARVIRHKKSPTIKVRAIFTMEIV